MGVSWRRESGRPAAALPLALLAAAAFLLLTSQPAAAGIVAKDGKIHACYKAKGKGKGTLRVVRSTKVRCPKKWKKVAWYASGVPGPRGATGATGATGERGEKGEKGIAGVIVVEELEDKVSELLTKVQQLESILNGITNTELKEAIAALANVAALEATVGSLCAQTETLTDQLNAVESALGGLSLNAVLTTLGGVLNIPTLPGGPCRATTARPSSGVPFSRYPGIRNTATQVSSSGPTSSGRVSPHSAIVRSSSARTILSTASTPAWPSRVRPQM